MRKITIIKDNIVVDLQIFEQKLDEIFYMRLFIYYLE